MKYTRFKITNFKGILEIALDLGKKPNLNIFTLVGLKGRGKAAVLEAINVFRNGINQKDAYTLIPKKLQYNFNDVVSIEAKVKIEENDKTKITDFLKSKYNFNTSKIEDYMTITREYKFNKSILDDNWLKISWHLPLWGRANQGGKDKILHEYNMGIWQDVINMIQNSYLPKILYYQDFLFKFPLRIYLEEFDDESIEQPEYRRIIEDILNSIEPGLSIQSSLLDRMKKPDNANTDALESLLNLMSDKLNNEILKKWNKIFNTTQIKGVEVQHRYEEDHDGIKRHYIMLKFKQGADNYFINEKSLEFRWLFSLLIFTVFRNSRPNELGETLFLLDEPASNLPQSFQQKLLHTLEDIISDSKLIYSTHSHHLINPKWLSGTFIVNNKAISYSGPGESNVIETGIHATPYKNFVANNKNEETHFKPILDALDYSPSQLEFVESIIFTEGKSDYYIFKYFLEVIFKGEYKLHFYPGAGVNKYEQIFSLYIAWNKRFVALFDSDNAGQGARKKCIDLIALDIADRVFTLENIDNKWQDYSIESLFTSEDTKAVIQSCYNSDELKKYNEKKMFHTAIQDLYIKEKVILFNQTTKDNFQKIFKFLENKLS